MRSWMPSRKRLPRCNAIPCSGGRTPTGQEGGSSAVARSWDLAGKPLGHALALVYHLLRARPLCISRIAHCDTQMGLARIHATQKAGRPSAMFRSSAKARIAARLPLAGRISRSSPSARTTRTVRLAVAWGMSTTTSRRKPYRSPAPSTGVAEPRAGPRCGTRARGQPIEYDVPRTQCPQNSALFCFPLFPAFRLTGFCPSLLNS